MPGVQTSNLGGSMNPSGGVATSFGSSMPNIAQQQTWNNPSWTQQAGAWLGSDSMSQGMGLGSMSNMNMILQADQMGGQLMGLLAGQNESTVGNIVKSIPGLSTVGNLINAAFGSHINEEFVRQTVLGTNAQKTKTFNSNTNSDVLNDWRGFNFLSNVTKDEVGSDGWFSNKAKNKTNELNNNINAANDLAILNFGHAVDNADANSDLRIAQSMVAAYGGPINSFRKYYDFGGSLYDTPQFFSAEPQVYDDGGYLSKAKALIRQNEGWRDKPYKDAPKGKNWRSVGYGFNDSGFREKYPEGISKHYEHGITKKQAEEELDYFLNKAEKQLKSIYGKQWDDFSDSQKAAILDTYYQRPASVGKSSRFYKAVTAGEDAGRYLGVAGYSRRNNIRQSVFGGSQDYVNLGIETENTESNPSTLQEITPFTPVVHDLDLSGITPTQAKALELNLASPVFDLSMFNKPSTPIVQQQTPAIGTVEDFLASYGDFEDNLFDNGGWLDFFQAWNQAQGGNNYFSGMGSSQWKPSDGLQRNTSNGSAQDWLGVAGTVVNTIGNWGKEDPSLGRGGGYSQFGMAAYDLMKTIRDATKHRKEPMDQKLGIPIYARGGRLFADSGNVGALGYAQIGTAALKLASNAKHQASLDDDIDEGKINRSIDRQGYSFDDAVANVNTNGDLLDLWKDYSEMPTNLTMRDFRDKSLFDDFLNGYAASWEGFNAGQNFGPWGAAIGAIVGGLSSNISSIIGRNKASNAADDANKRLERANERMLADLNYGAERVDAENDLRILQNMDTVSNAANGGKLNVDFGLKSPFVMPDGTANPLFKAFGGGLTHGSNFDTGINWVNEGKSHEQNPLGGVPMGMDEQGIPNLVEEGEAIWNGDYVFSKRMKVPKKLRDKYKLPDDATFADAVAKLTKDSEERPLSNIDRATNNHILGEFADTQEEMRMAKAQRAMDREMQLRDDFINGFNVGAFGGSLFSDGGGIHIDPSKKGTFKAQASKMGMGVQEAASHILANKENYSPAMVKKAVFAHNFAHADGGDLFSDPFGEPSFYANTFDWGGDLRAKRDKVMKDNGLTEEQANIWVLKQLSGADRGKAIKSKVFGDWYPTYNSNGELVETSRRTAVASNRGTGNGQGSQSTQAAAKKSGAGQKTAVTKPSVGSTGLNTYKYDPIETFKYWDKDNADYDEGYRDFIENKLNEDWITRVMNGQYGDMSRYKGANKVNPTVEQAWQLGLDKKNSDWHKAMAAAYDEYQKGIDPKTGKANTPAVEWPDENWEFDPYSEGWEARRGISTEPVTTKPDDKGITKSPFKPKQTWTRYAPIAMNALFGLKEMLTPADYGNADAIMAAAYQAGSPVSIGTEYIGDYRKRDPFDERYLMNIINQNRAAANRNMMNFSGGNRAIGMAGILTNDLTSQMSLAEAARQAYLANRADDADVAAFNKDTNKYNATAQNTRNLSLAQLNSGRQSAMLSGIAQGARLRQAIKDQRDAAISANLTNFAQGLGDLGKENGYYNMLGGLNEEGILKYFYGDDWRTKFNNVNV